jgi:hypothetical protein
VLARLEAQVVVEAAAGEIVEDDEDEPPLQGKNKMAAKCATKIFWDIFSRSIQSINPVLPPPPSIRVQNEKIDIVGRGLRLQSKENDHAPAKGSATLI